MFYILQIRFNRRGVLKNRADSDQRVTIPAPLIALDTVSRTLVSFISEGHRAPHILGRHLSRDPHGANYRIYSPTSESRSGRSRTGALAATVRVSRVKGCAASSPFIASGRLLDRPSFADVPVGALLRRVGSDDDGYTFLKINRAQYVWNFDEFRTFDFAGQAIDLYYISRPEAVRVEIVVESAVRVKPWWETKRHREEAEMIDVIAEARRIVEHPEPASEIECDAEGTL
jgi:hypothetical protein